MQAHRDSLSRIHEAMQWFLVAEELRLLHVVVSQDMRLATLEQIGLSEHSSLNTRPFAVLEAPVEEDDDGWALRATELRDDWEQLRELYAGSEPTVTLPALAEPLESAGLVAFGGELRWMLEHLPEPAAGLTVVLAPLWVRAPQVWLEGLRALVAQRGLEGARFVVVETDEALIAPLTEELGERADALDARLDAGAAQADLNTLIDNIASAPAGAGGARLSGMAGPSVAPPRRWNAGPQLEPEDAGRLYFDAELPSGLSDQARVQELKVLILRAGQAAQAGDPGRAIPLQRQAVSRAVDIGLDREAIVLQLALGSYHLQAGDPKGAEQLYEQARTVALSDMHADMAVQAQLALAAAQLLDKRPLEAAVSYLWAGRLSADTSQSVLGIEAYRLAGQIYANEGRVEEAGDAWRQALDFADAASEDERKASSAAEAAEQLAAHCRAQGLCEQAAALDAQAARLRAEADAADAPAEIA